MTAESTGNDVPSGSDSALALVSGQRLRRVFAGIAALGVVAIIVMSLLFGEATKATDEPTVPKKAEDLSFADLCESGATSEVAATIVRERQTDLYPVAKRIYLAQLRVDPDNTCAGAGLAELARAEEEAADAAAVKALLDQTWAEEREAELKDLTKNWSTPSVALLTACVGVVLFLLVLARLANRFAVRPNTPGLVDDRRRRIIAGVGLAFIAWASLGPLLVATDVPGIREDVAAVATWLAGCLAMTSLFRNDNAKGWGAARAVAGITLLATTAYLVAGFISTAGWLQHRALVTAVAAGLLGVFLLAFGTGLALRVRVQVRDSSGDADVTAGQLLIARLEGLGSRRPTGLRAAEGADVTSLPEEALTDVPTGSIAKLVFQLLKVVRPSAPWSVDASLTDDAATVRITRNGLAVDEGSRAFRPVDVVRPVPSGGDKADDADDTGPMSTKEQLLTAIASFSLLRLTRPHPQLREGLCGLEGDRWRALTTHDLATRRGVSAEDRTRLLRVAVEDSPGYLLARMSLLEEADVSDPESRERYANDVERLWDDFANNLGGTVSPAQAVGQASPGWGAAQLRLLFSRSVAWFNVRTDRAIAAANPPPEDPANGADPLDDPDDAWRSSAAAVRQLRNVLDDADDELELLAGALELPSAFLVLDLFQTRPSDTPEGQWAVLVAWITEQHTEINAELEGGFRPRRRHDYYALACVRAGGELTLTESLDLLEVAATDEHLGEYAQTDASFAMFNGQLTNGLPADHALVTRFKTIVVEAPEDDMFKLAAFKKHQEALEAFGVHDLATMAQSSVVEVTSRIRVSSAVARRWISIADLFVRAVEPTRTSSAAAAQELLAMLLDADGVSVSALRAKLTDQDSRAEFLATLNDGSRTRRTTPTVEDVAFWDQLGD